MLPTSPDFQLAIRNTRRLVTEGAFITKVVMSTGRQFMAVSKHVLDFRFAVSCTAGVQFRPCH